MSSTSYIRQLLKAPASCRTSFFPPSRPQSRTFALLAPHARYISLPRILQPSFWALFVPKAFRNRSDAPHISREWNPATPYIVLGLLVGSQAIQILWLKQDRGHSLRKADAKIGLLKEVIERVQRGEDVPVESLLGTGKEESEKEWAESKFHCLLLLMGGRFADFGAVLKDMEDEEVLFQSKKRRKALRKAAAEEAAQEEAAQAQKEEHEEVVVDNDGKVRVESVNGVRFY
jgi:hypothetical protein